ncbi:hypothetical protein [Eisenibacter elegans]|uniref:hypothetical protein n=1 Tax=Eisenibacter elegans TaxID=997 RepID=UPI0012B5EBE8|nr:hypothetical protein [Eisenibacter elegans]
MFTYFIRIHEHWKQDVMALALLTDDNPDFHPNQYHYQYRDTALVYRFATLKLLEKSEAELEIAGNPFSIGMLAARKALIKQNLSDDKQLVWKMDLVRSLQNTNYEQYKTRNLLHFIRCYVRFDKRANFSTFDKQIQETLK